MNTLELCYHLQYILPNDIIRVIHHLINNLLNADFNRLKKDVEDELYKLCNPGTDISKIITYSPSRFTRGRYQNKNIHYIEYELCVSINDDNLRLNKIGMNTNSYHFQNKLIQRPDLFIQQPTGYWRSDFCVTRRISLDGRLLRSNAKAKQYVKKMNKPINDIYYL